MICVLDVLGGRTSATRDTRLMCVFEDLLYVTPPSLSSVILVFFKGGCHIPSKSSTSVTWSRGWQFFFFFPVWGPETPLSNHCRLFLNMSRVLHPPRERLWRDHPNHKPKKAVFGFTSHQLASESVGRVAARPTRTRTLIQNNTSGWLRSGYEPVWVPQPDYDSGIPSYWYATEISMCICKAL